MTYKYMYKTPDAFSNMIMNSDGENLTGLWFEDSRDLSKHIIDCEEKELEIFKETSKWLDIYFRGKEPNFTPKYKINNLTPFRKEVIDVRNSIMIRCKWCNLKNQKYVEYHDNEWCKPNFNDGYLFEMLILESFQAGLSWECVLNKREDFRKALDNFDINKICNYEENKIQELLQNKKIIRNKLKIKATINNSKIFKKIQNEYGTFYNYLQTFTNDKIIYEIDKTTNQLSDMLSKDLQKRGMKFVGSTIIYSYLQAIGVIYSHDKECFLYKQIPFYEKCDKINKK